MGNTSASQVKRDRNYYYTIDNVNQARDSSSPRPDESKTFDFIGGKKKPLLCYQSSTEYSVDDNYDEYKVRPRASTISQGTSIDENALPTVFKWEGGGKEVYITGTFSDWKPIKMVNSHDDFVAIVDVPEGTHQYKYIVDGDERINANAFLDDDKSKNIINVKKSDFEVFEALAMDLAANNSSNQSQLSGSPPGSYSQDCSSSIKSKCEGGGNNGQSGHHGAGPPILPPHLLQVILNNPNVNSGDPTFLPQPNHVMLNHLYALSIKDGVMVLSCTNRYRKKYVTTLLYKPI